MDDQDPAANDAALKRPTDSAGAALERLAAIMTRLRGPGGCPWDREQTFETIAPYTIEEAYEVADAIERGDPEDLRDELGDLLLQVVYHSRMAEELGAFDVHAVAEAVSDKMIRRHPHVFEGATEFDWNAIKAAERAEKAARKAEAGQPPEAETGKSLLDGVPTALPSLLRAVKLQARAGKVGFDWLEPELILNKVVEEAHEVAEAARAAKADGLDPVEQTARKADVAEEIGDLLFVLANLARRLDVDPEAALRGTNAKFIRRFQGVEARLADQGRSPLEATLEEMDALWDEIKRAEKAARAAKD